MRHFSWELVAVIHCLLYYPSSLHAIRVLKQGVRAFAAEVQAIISEAFVALAFSLASFIILVALAVTIAVFVSSVFYAA